MSLWEKLKNIGFVEATYPEKTIDVLSENYKIFNFFHKTQYKKSKHILIKYDMFVYFDDYNVDFYSNKHNITFGKRDLSDDIFNYIDNINKRTDRQLKLKRIRE